MYQQLPKNQAGVSIKRSILEKNSISLQLRWKESCYLISTLPQEVIVIPRMPTVNRLMKEVMFYSIPRKSWNFLIPMHGKSTAGIIETIGRYVMGLVCVRNRGWILGARPSKQTILFMTIGHTGNDLAIFSVSAFKKMAHSSTIYILSTSLQRTKKYNCYQSHVWVRRGGG